MERLKRYVIGLLLLVSFVASIMQTQGCRNKTKEFDVVFADSTKASELIILDDSDHFFNHITPIDVAIQMKNEKGFSTRENAVNAYKSFLKSQVMTPNDADRKLVDSLFYYVKQGLEKLNTHLLLPKINIVKIRTDHYGLSAYYTRGNTIFIPENIFNKSDFTEQVKVMNHEVWHILSRTYPQLKKDAYALIGFAEHGKKIRFDTEMGSNLLTNPDGVSNNYALMMNGMEILPIITSMNEKYSPEHTTFFEYLKFDFYEIDSTGYVDSIPAPIGTTEGFFEKIKDNTEYIIHPDEIIADNFSLAVKANETQDYSSFSEGGKKLILDFTKLLKAFDR